MTVSRPFIAAGLAAAVLIAAPASAATTVFAVNGMYLTDAMLGGSFTIDPSTCPDLAAGCDPASAYGFDLTFRGGALKNAALLAQAFDAATRTVTLTVGADPVNGYTSTRIEMKMAADSLAAFRQGDLTSSALNGSVKLGHVWFPSTWTLSTNSTVTTNFVASNVAAVPEPATWALMLAGFGLAGATLRRRPRTTVAFA